MGQKRYPAAPTSRPAIQQMPICSVPYVRPGEPVQLSCCHGQIPKPCKLHLDEISRRVARKAHAAVLMDRAGWHTTGKLKVPKNITIILLPSRSPELNPVENIWQ